MILNQSKQIFRVSIDSVEFGSGFDQADTSLTINQELGFARAFSEEFESITIQLVVTLFLRLFQITGCFSRPKYLG